MAAEKGQVGTLKELLAAGAEKDARTDSRPRPRFVTDDRFRCGAGDFAAPNMPRRQAWEDASSCGAQDGLDGVKTCCVPVDSLSEQSNSLSECRDSPNSVLKAFLTCSRNCVH